MNYKFLFISAEDAKKDPTKVGFGYAKLHKSEWVDGPSDLNGILTVGVNKGVDNVMYQDKAYQINRLFFGIEDSTILVICVESPFGPDNKTVFND